MDHKQRLREKKWQRARSYSDECRYEFGVIIFDFNLMSHLLSKKTMNEVGNDGNWVSSTSFIVFQSSKLKSLKQIIFLLFSVLSGTRNREKETGFGDARSVTVRTTVSIQA